MRTLEVICSGAATDPAAPALALVHGWGIGRGAWDAVLPELEPDFRVHRVALPGYDGCAEHGDDAADFDACARALAAALPAGATLCGWSLGALLALRAAQLAPGHFARLALCAATPCFAQREDWPHAQPAALLAGFSAAVAQHPAATRQRFVALFNQGDARARAVTRTLTRTLAGEVASPDAATLARGLAWLGAVDLRAALLTDAPRLPTLLIHGDADPLMPLAAAQWLARVLPGARLEVCAGAAHAPFVGAPAAFARTLSDFCHGR